MTQQPQQPAANPPVEMHQSMPAEAPFVCAPEGVKTVFSITLLAACAPLLAGLLLFGWQAAKVAALCVATCVVLEWLVFRITHAPAMQGRTHAILTGVLLALTLPPMVPWYIPVIAAACATLIGKVAFGGVGHFVWQPALVGRLAVAVLFPALLNPAVWPVLAQNKMLTGNISLAARPVTYAQWRGTPAPDGADAFLLKPIPAILAGISRTDTPEFSGLASIRTEIPHAKTALLNPTVLPPMPDLFIGARPGGIGETVSIVLVVAGLYLIYRGYVKWQLPVCFLVAACVVFMISPIKLAGPNNTTDVIWWPLLQEDWEVGMIYLCYQVLGSEMLLAAFFLATETTSRPTTSGGQVIFGLGCGTIAALLQLYVDTAIPAYLAVLAMNTFTPVIESLWRPRVLGQPTIWKRMLLNRS